MHKYSIYTFLILFSLLQNSCTDNKSEKNDSYKNYPELQRVIAHYEKSGDEQKQKAVKFLIENMEGLFCYEGGLIDKYDPFFSYLDYLNKNKIDKKVSRESLELTPDIMSKWNQIQHNITRADYENIKYKMDISGISANYLINNIDKAFAEWKNNTWSKHIAFDDFCEYILPYRAFNESAENWRDYFQKKYNPIKQHFSGKTDPTSIADSINKEIETWFNFSTIFYQYPFDMGLERLIQGQIGGCNHMVTVATYANRSLGIACAIDNVPQYGNRSMGHTWNVVFDENMQAVPYNGASTEWLNMGYVFHKQTLDIKIPKVHRRTFAIQHNSLAEIRNKEEYIPTSFDDNRYIDVTAEYIPVSDVVINIPEGFAHNTSRFVYLCVFNNKDWIPVEWSKIENNSATFADMGRDIVYLPVYYKDKKIVPLSDPLLLDKSGNIQYIQMYKGMAQAAKLFYKYPPSLTAVNDTTNSIVRGDEYELFYWDNKWVSLGKKTTRDRKADMDSLGFDFKKDMFFADVNDREFLFFENVPVGALFLLHNHTRGKEERIFTLEDSQQIWW